MKSEIRDIAYELVVRTTPAGFIAWWSDINWTTVLAITLGVLQIVYLIRKWIREEQAWGVRLKRWAKNTFTQPGDLQ
jgi:hypothetical protein